MDYPLENLGPERFQEFCQALLLSDSPNIRCLPVAQPDGGRDAIDGDASSEFIIYQIKFTREPAKVDEIADYLIGIIKDELTKIEKLVARGAKRYILITNLSGSAHLDSGSIDRVQKFLDDSITIPASVLWRMDIARRLDSAWDLKWAYPELMTGPDLIRALTESSNKDDEQRRESAVKAFLADQFERDKDVKFRQVDLQNALFDLFIDVPVALTANLYKRAVMPLSLERISAAINNLKVHRVENQNEINPPTPYLSQSDAPPIFHHTIERSVGAARLLLDGVTQDIFTRMVVEGAPGQGKSTITQYVCQVHRAILLGKALPLTLVSYSDLTRRLPLRVDLRDLAVWFSKRNPFSINKIDPLDTAHQISLEGFLAFLVAHHSGGTQFFVDDLIAIAKKSKLLLIFDGLDEVADIKTRRLLIDEISMGLARIEKNTLSLQVVITTRPASLPDSPKFEKADFLYLHLEQLDRDSVFRYANKWADTKKLGKPDKMHLIETLSQKLSQPHLRELAKNTMQLTILLSLINVRGASLPDKRTALYDSYVDLFLSRESEKSSIVRDNRELLRDIYQALAWHLHSTAETTNRTGRISQERLYKFVNQFLKRRQHPSDLADSLFTGLVDRIVFLVSRVQGTYEFEVQPLREYFAARHLYETAPYSPAGNEKGGTKPDIFLSICKKRYWFNVTRFFAGCYSSGELASLVSAFEEITIDENYDLMSYPRYLAYTLLSDWVFSQQPKLISRLIDFISNRPPSLIMQSFDVYGIDSMHSTSLSDQCGRSELRKKLIPLLFINNTKWTGWLTRTINALGSIPELKTTFENMPTSASEKKARQWLQAVSQLGLIKDLDEAVVESVIARIRLSDQDIYELFNIGAISYCSGYPLQLEKIIKDTIHGHFSVSGYPMIETGVQTVMGLSEGEPYLPFDPSPKTIDQSQEYMAKTVHIGSVSSKFADECQSFNDCVRELLDKEKVDFGVVFHKLSDNSLSKFGSCWATYVAAVMAFVCGASVNGKSAGLLEESEDLVLRISFAARVGDNAQWWLNQLSAVENHEQKMFVLLIITLFAQKLNSEPLIEEITSAVSSLDDASWEVLYRTAQNILTIVAADEEAVDKAFAKGRSISGKLNQRYVALISIMSTHDDVVAWYEKYGLKKPSGDSVVDAITTTMLCCIFVRNIKTDKWKAPLEKLTKFPIQMRHTHIEGIYDAITETDYGVSPSRYILKRADKYPHVLVSRADGCLFSHMERILIPVAQTAKQNGWECSKI
jgi:hypothetical protein